MIKIFILIVSIYIFIYCFLVKQDYINVAHVLKKQLLSVLKKKSVRRKSDVYSFINIYIIPLILAFCVALENMISKNFYENIIIILSILVSVFLTLISILTSKNYKDKTEKQKTVVDLTFNNVYFLTVISILLLIFCILKISISSIEFNLFKDNVIICKMFSANNFEIAFNTIVVYLIVEIIMHLLIVLKRIQQIFFITFDE